MNLHNLEKVARLSLKGDNVKNESENMLKAGMLTPTEHRSVSSLSWQIAANVRAGAGADGGTVAIVKPMGAWL